MSAKGLFTPGALAEPENPDAVLAHMRSRQAPGYLFDPATVAALNDRVRSYPEYLSALFDRADHAVDGEFILAGNTPAGSYLACGPEIDWHHTPNGDREGLFTLNRHFWFFDLARAFRLSGDRRYLDALLDQLLHWIAACPAPTDGLPHFHDFSPWKVLNGAIRITDSWLPAYFLLVHDPALPASAHLQWLDAIAEHARILSEHIFDRTHNHTVEEMGALLEISLCFPELAGAESRRDTAQEVLEACMAAQVFDDGVHFEATPAYHKHSMEWFILPFLVARRNGLRFSTGYEEKLARMAGFAAASSFPDGSTVPFGDSDRNALQRGLSDRDFLSGLTTAAFGSVPGAPAPGVPATPPHPAFLWTIGSDTPAEQAPAEKSDAGSPESYALATSAASAGRPDSTLQAAYPLGYPEGGFYAFTDVRAHAAGERESFYAAVRNGPTNHGHPHADLLSVILYAGGRLWLTDTGKYTYNECPERRHLKGTLAHNTIRIDEQDQTPYRDRMSFGAELAYATRSFVEEAEYSFFDGEHYGYRRLPMAVDHRRQIVWIRGAGLLVVDRIVGSGAHLYEQCWHIPGSDGIRLDGVPFRLPETTEEMRRPHASELSVDPGADGAVLRVDRDGGRLVVVPAAGPVWAQLHWTWHSPAYGERRPGALLRYGRRGVPPLVMASWIEVADSAEGGAGEGSPQAERQAGGTAERAYAVTVEQDAEEGAAAGTDKGAAGPDEGGARPAGLGRAAGTEEGAARRARDLRAEDLDTQSTRRRSPDELTEGRPTPRLSCSIHRPGGDYRVVIDDEVRVLERV